MGAPIPLNQVQRLQQRCDKINALYRNDRKKYKYCRAILSMSIVAARASRLMCFFIIPTEGRKVRNWQTR